MSIPVTEGSIEAKHALVKMALCDSGLKGSTVEIRSSNRVPELRQQIQRDPAERGIIVMCKAFVVWVFTLCSGHCELGATVYTPKLCGLCCVVQTLGRTRCPPVHRRSLSRRHAW